LVVRLEKFLGVETAIVVVADPQAVRVSNKIISKAKVEINFSSFYLK
jgi:hypothetical protein